MKVTINLTKKQIQSILNQLNKNSQEPIEVTVEEAKEHVIKKIADVKFSDEHRVQGNIVASLKRNKVSTVKKLAKMTEKELLALPRISKGTIKRIVDALEAIGVKLKG